MRPAFKYGLFTVSILMFAALGFAAGQSLMRENSAPQSGPEKSSPHTIYKVALSSQGPLQRTVPLTPEKDGGGMRAASDSPGIQPGQPITLYNGRGEPLTPSAAVIRAEDGHVFLTLPPELNGETIARADIVLFETAFAKRVPLSALVREDSGTFLWVAVTDKSLTRHTARKRPLDSVIAGNEFFDAGNAIYGREAVILNPDPGLRDGQEIRVEMTSFEAPLKTPAEIALQLERDRQAREADARALTAVERGEVQVDRSGCPPMPAPAGEPVSADLYLSCPAAAAETP